MERSKRGDKGRRVHAGREGGAARREQALAVRRSRRRAARRAEADADALAARPPLTADELHAWLIRHLEVRVPRTVVTEGHCAPFAYLVHTFFEGRGQMGEGLGRAVAGWEESGKGEGGGGKGERKEEKGERGGEERGERSKFRVQSSKLKRAGREDDSHGLPAIEEEGGVEGVGAGQAVAPAPDCVVWSCRGGGKTFLGAVATALDLIFKPGMEVRILSGSLQQAGRMLGYLRRFFQRPGLRGLVAGRFSARWLSLRNGSRVEVLARSHSSIRGEHVQKLRCDEVDLFKVEMWEAAQLMTKSKVCGPFVARGAVECLSTMHRPYGIMARVIDEAAEGKRVLFRWGLMEVVEECGRERRCRAAEERSGGVAEWQSGKVEEGKDGATGATGVGAGPVEHEGIRVVEKAPTSPLRGSPPPSGRMGEEAVSLPVIEARDCVLLAECGGRAKSRAEGGMEREPGHLSIGDVIVMKGRVSESTWAAEMLCLRARRSDNVFPEFDAETHVVHEDPARWGVVSARESAEAMGTWVAGIDFGIRAPAVVLWGAVSADGVLTVMDERVEQGLVVRAHAGAIMSGRWPRPAWVGIDPAGNSRSDQTGESNADVLRRAGLRVRDRRLREWFGLELIRARLRPADGSPARLRVHARCRKLIEALEQYHYPEDRPWSLEPVKGTHSHAADALRYLVVNLDRPPGTVGVGNYLRG